MLSPAIARALRARGHDVEAIKGHPNLEGLPDSDVVAVARNEQRAIVTSNVRDFRPIHVELITPGGTGHVGFVFVLTTAWGSHEVEDDAQAILDFPQGRVGHLAPTLDQAPLLGGVDLLG